MIHEDERRILESFPEAKKIKAKQDCIIGQHYHKIKTEMFILSSGECMMRLRMRNGKFFDQKMKIGKVETVGVSTYHEFHIKKGSVLIGINSHPYDPTDDYKE